MSDFLETYELYHYGVQGQKWGERRYQYQDGSLTPEGKRHYGIGDRIKKSIIKTGTKINKANEKRRKRWEHYKEQATIVKDLGKTTNEEFAKDPGRKGHFFEQSDKLNAARARAGMKMANKYGAEKFAKAVNDTTNRQIGKIIVGDLLIGAAGIATTAAIIANMKD